MSVLDHEAQHVEGPGAQRQFDTVARQLALFRRQEEFAEAEG